MCPDDTSGEKEDLEARRAAAEARLRELRKVRDTPRSFNEFAERKISDERAEKNKPPEDPDPSAG
jgi:hypothetical protein